MCGGGCCRGFRRRRRNTCGEQKNDGSGAKLEQETVAVKSFPRKINIAGGLLLVSLPPPSPSEDTFVSLEARCTRILSPRRRHRLYLRARRKLDVQPALTTITPIIMDLPILIPPPLSPFVHMCLVIAWMKLVVIKGVTGTLIFIGMLAMMIMSGLLMIVFMSMPLILPVFPDVLFTCGAFRCRLCGAA